MTHPASTRPRRGPHAGWTAALLALTGALAIPLTGQDPASEEEDQVSLAHPQAHLPLIERDPFDRVLLDETNQSAFLDVAPLDFPGRKVPQADPRSLLKVRLLADEKEYEIFWRNIRTVILWEQLLLNEAERLRNEADYDRAFDYYYKLKQEYPNLPRLEESINDYLYLDAAQLVREERYAEALGSIEQLYDRSRNYRYDANSPTLVDFMGRLIDRLVSSYDQQQDYQSARDLIKRVRDKYMDAAPPQVETWAGNLASLATQKRDRARALLAEKKYHDALAAAREMVDIWPDVQGGTRLYQELAEQYPLVTVGVVQNASAHDAQRLDDWGARRTGRLVRRSLVEFLGAGPEGGQYRFALGSTERREDSRGMTFRLDRFAQDEGGPAISGFDVADRLLNMADPRSPRYIPAWGGLLADVQVEDVTQVRVQFRRPHVLPEALLRVRLQPTAAPGDGAPADGEPGDAEQGDGPFRIHSKSVDKIQFISKTFQTGDRLAEIVEQRYKTTQQALSALRRGDVDVVDRLFPADAARLQANLSRNDVIAVQRYALPTVHMLAFTSDNRFFEDRNFRRALLFAIDRERILKQELLGNRENNRDLLGCRVISGPFPAGSGPQDPLGYAYDETIPPRGYEPRLAKLQVFVTTNALREEANRLGHETPELETIVLGHPAHEMARVACQAIAAQWRIIGLECALKEFAPGVTRDLEDECDVVYTEIAIWEPVSDARRLLGEDGLFPSSNSYVSRAVRFLDQARDWGEVRERLLQLHRTAYNEVPLIPLWQTVDSFAYHKRLHNIGESPVWLYQNVDQWRLGSIAEETAD